MPNSRLTVLGVVSDLLYGGTENRLLNIARAIDRSRFDYRVATFYAPSAALEAQYGSMRSEFSDAGISVECLALPRPSISAHVLPIKLLSTASILARSVVRLREYLIAQRIDIVDAHLDAGLFVAVPAARTAGVPVTVTLYGAETIESRRWMRPLRRFSMRSVNAVFTDSIRRANDITSFVGRRPPPTYVIPNGVRLAKPTRDRRAVLEALSLPTTASTIVGQVGGLVPYKGHTTLLHAAHRVLDARPDVYFVCVGFPRAGMDYVGSLERHARQLGIHDRVRFAPYAGSIADIWQVIDIHVHASDLDSLPNAIIEGMSLEKPAVVTDVGGVAELVEHERTGLVVPPRDPVALANGIMRLLSDDALVRRLARGAHARYQERCAPEVTAKQIEHRLEAIYHRSLNNGQRNRAWSTRAAG